MGVGFPAKIWQDLLGSSEDCELFSWLESPWGQALSLSCYSFILGWSIVPSIGLGPQKVFPELNWEGKSIPKWMPWTWDSPEPQVLSFTTLKCLADTWLPVSVVLDSDATLQRGCNTLVVPIPGWSLLTWVLVKSIELQAPFSELEIPYI